MGTSTLPAFLAGVALPLAITAIVAHADEGPEQNSTASDNESQGENEADERASSSLIQSRLRFFRWQEDYSDLGPPGRRPGGLDRLKFIPFDASGTTYLTLGGNYRLRIEAVDNFLYGIPGVDDFTSVKNRFLIHADLHIAEHLRGFFQLGAYHETGFPGGSIPIEESGPDFHQAFIEGAFSAGRHATFKGRLGRQELPVGSSRLFGIRETINQRLAFDAAHAALSTEKLAVSLFFGRPVSGNKQAFGDSSSFDEVVWGLYGTALRALDEIRIDAFYIGRETPAVAYLQGTVGETRHTVGARIHGSLHGLAASWEAAYQFGETDTGQISAWGLATETSYEFADVATAPRLTLRANAASGDDDPTNPDVQTFHALYPNLAYFSQAATYAPTNAVDVHPRVELRPGSHWTAYAGITWIWRLSTDDAIYAAGYRPLLSVGDDRYTTALFEAGASFSPTPRIQIDLATVVATAGPLVRANAGQTVRFFALNTSLQF